LKAHRKPGLSACRTHSSGADLPFEYTEILSANHKNLPIVTLMQLFLKCKCICRSPLLAHAAIESQAGLFQISPIPCSISSAARRGRVMFEMKLVLVGMPVIKKNKLSGLQVKLFYSESE
jgi:hypothetical protein